MAERELLVTKAEMPDSIYSERHGITVIVDGPRGTVEVAPDGKSVRYTPPAKGATTDVISITVTDKLGD